MALRLPAFLFLVAVLLAAATVSAAPAKAKAEPFYYDPADPRVATVTAKEFREKIMDPTLPVVVNFYSPRIRACRAFAAEFLKAIDALPGGYARFAAIDATTEEGKQLAQMFGVQSFPTTMIFNPEMMPVAGGQEGQYMKMPLTFAGQPTAAALIQFVFEGTAGHDITILEDLGDWRDFVDQYRLMDIPKIVYVTEQTNFTSPAFKALAHEFRYGALFGVVHGASVAQALAASSSDDPLTVTLKGELLAHLGVGTKAAATLPALIFASGLQDTPEAVKDIQEMGLEQLKAAVAKIAWPESKRRENMAFFLEDANNRRKKEAEDAKKNRALPVVTAYDAATWETHCVKRKKGVCGAVFVENPEDEALATWLAAASKQMAQRSSTVSQFVVLSAPQNPELAQFFGATDMGIPTIVFITPGKKMYHNLVGSFSERGAVNYFMDKVTKHKGKPYDPANVPSFAVPQEEEVEPAAPSTGGSDDEIIVEDL